MSQEKCPGRRGEKTNFPHEVPQNTFSREQLTFSTILFPHAQRLLVKKEQGGQGLGSSWHKCGCFLCPHGGGGRLQGKLQKIFVPHGIGGAKTVPLQ